MHFMLLSLDDRLFMASVDIYASLILLSWQDFTHVLPGNIFKIVFGEQKHHVCQHFTSDCNKETENGWGGSSPAPIWTAVLDRGK